MKILVPQKQVKELGPVIPNSGIELATLGGTKMVNPFCAIALEAAVRLRDLMQVDEILVVSIGDKDCQKMLGKSLACGADRALLIETPDDDQLLPLDIARILQQLIAQEKPDLVLMGKQAVDYDSNQVGQMLSALLDWPIVNAAAKITPNGNQLCVEHEVDEGTRVLAIPLPGIVTVDLHLNEPRSPGLPDVVKARSKPLATLSCEQFLAAPGRHLQLVELFAPQRESNIKMLDDVKDLAKIIRTHAQRH